MPSLAAARDRRGRRETFALRLFAAAMAAAAIVAAVFAFLATQHANDLEDRADQADQVAAALAAPGASVVPLAGPDGASGAAVVLAEGQERCRDHARERAQRPDVPGVVDPGRRRRPPLIGTLEGGDDDAVVALPADAFTGGATVAITAVARRRVARPDDRALPARPGLEASGRLFVLEQQPRVDRRVARLDEGERRADVLPWPATSIVDRERPVERAAPGRAGSRC